MAGGYCRNALRARAWINNSKQVISRTGVFRGAASSFTRRVVQSRSFSESSHSDSLPSRRFSDSKIPQFNSTRRNMTRPFDPKAASLYGQFVQAAYSMFSAAPADLTPPQSDDFPDGYRMVAWIQMQGFILGSTPPLFYGLIAKNTLVANQFVVAIRGTANGVEWWDDLYAAEQIPFRVPVCGKVADGFARIYDTLVVAECEVVSAAPGAA